MPTTFNLRVTLWVLLGMALFLNYQTWMHDYSVTEVPSAATLNAPAPAPLGSVAPTAIQPATTTSAPATPAPVAAPTASNSLTDATQSDAKAPSVHVMTDVLDAEVSRLPRVITGQPRTLVVDTHPSPPG